MAIDIEIYVGATMNHVSHFQVSLARDIALAHIGPNVDPHAGFNQRNFGMSFFIDYRHHDSRTIFWLESSARGVVIAW